MTAPDGQDPASGGARKPWFHPRRWWWKYPLDALIILVEWGFLAVAIASAIFAWRLAQGPVDLSWALPRLTRIVAVAAPTIDAEVGHLALAWNGFKQGPDQPLRVTSDDINVVDNAHDRSLGLDHLGVDLSMGWAAHGVFAPRVVTLDGLQLTMRRAPPAQQIAENTAEQARATDLRQTLRDIIAVLRQPPQSDKHLLPVKDAQLSELRRVTLTHGSVTLQPASGAEGQAGLVGRALQIGEMSATIVRGDAGGLTGQVAAVLASRAGPLPPQTAGARPSLQVSFTETPQGDVAVQTAAALDNPAGMMAAIQLPGDLPVPSFPLQVKTELDASAAAVVTSFRVAVSAGAGGLLINGASIPIASLGLLLTGDENNLAIDPSSHIALAAVSAQPPPTIAFSGQGKRTDRTLGLTIGLGLDHLASDDLPSYWPPGFADGARKWIKAQVKDGSVHDGHFQFVVTGNPDFSNIGLTGVSGSLPATGLTVAWLPPLPPMTKVNGAITLQGMDAIKIGVTNAVQGDQAITNSGIVITGLSAKDQIGSITVNLSGPVASAVAIISQPRLHLLKALPVPLTVTGGSFQGSLSLSLPLDDNVTTGQIKMQTHDVIQNLILSDLLLGRNLTKGNLTIDATMNGLTMNGTAALAGIPATAVLVTDFNAGPPSKVIATLKVKAQADETQLAAADIPTGGILKGAADLNLTLAAQNGGRTDINATITLPESRLSVGQIAWAGGAGTATATAHVALQGSRIIALDDLALTGPGLALKVRSGFTGSRLSTVTIDALQLGRTDLHGSFGLPAAKTDPYVIVIAGPALDLSGIFGPAKKAAPSVKPANSALSQISSPDEFKPHPPWRATVNLDRIIFGKTADGTTRELDRVRGTVVNDGVVVRSADVSLTVAPSGAASHLTVVPQPNQARQVRLTSGDFGGLLRATNAYDAIAGGVLDISGAYDDSRPNHPLTGNAEMDKFSLGDAPTVAKMLQAMTLYGVVDLMHGPGLFFSKMVAPFHLADRRLDLHEARAYSASLGLTADGSVDLPRNNFDIQGTIVPAYFFNSLLGHIPLIGKLFSPEKGGGLFAAKFQLVGPINNPAVHVNALSMIAPGFLRDLFNHRPQGQTSAPSQK
ncbi:hypothetical protein ACELLULO517_21530 [Acidisoma cellulosilytica]|uniref:DUF3971 domain-containing protein n=1 Tax=Acidisoma cellulosilyticum TaxID=2802395 RepID=A0A964E5V6_9PROT|nr:DUF3971 domain-containing protein [Acidisoma cellulosilyticum]MCB8882842.1 hypothetical protein [Acidisoma cellulosilyticum]